MKRIYTIETSTGIRFTGNEKSRKRHKVYFRLKNQTQGGQAISTTEETMQFLIRSFEMGGYDVLLIT